MATQLLGRASGQAKNSNQYEADIAADESAKIGAATRRKERRESAAETEAFNQSMAEDKAVVWERVISANGEPRIVRMRVDAGAYDDRGLASLAARAAREAASAAKKGRIVKKGQRLPRVVLSDAELESLASELAIMILEAQPERRRKEKRLPKAGEVAGKLATGKVAEAIENGDLSGYRADLAACRAKALDLIRFEGGRQDWRDCAEAVRRAEADSIEHAAEKRDYLGEAESHAHSDPYLMPASPARHPIAPETQAVLYLSGLGKRERMAIEAALAAGRASAADMAKACGTKTANAYRKATTLGRKALREAMADPLRRESLCAHLQEIAEADAGPRREDAQSTGSLMREPAPMGPQAKRMAREAILRSSPSDAQARRMVRVYVERHLGTAQLEALSRDLRAARIAAENFSGSDAELEKLRQRIKALAIAHRHERMRTIHA